MSGGIRTPGVERIHDPVAAARRGRARPLAAPKRLEDFVGQERVKEQLAVFIEAAKARGEALDHVLLAGPPGLGKTSLAQIVAAELGAPFVQTAGPALERKGDVASYLTALEPRSVFFVDEIHRLPRALEETFYPAMEDRKLPITVGQGAGARVVTLDLPRVHADRRHHARRPAHHAAARPLRRDPPPRPLRRRRPGRDRAPLGRDPRRGDRRPGRRGDRRRARAAPRAWPTACSSACATSPRCAAPGRSTPRVAGRGARPARGRHAGLDRLDREILRAICEKFDGGPVGLSTLRSPWGRSPTRSRTSTSPTCSSRASSSARRAAGWPPTPPSSTSGSRRRADAPQRLF